MNVNELRTLRPFLNHKQMESSSAVGSVNPKAVVFQLRPTFFSLPSPAAVVGGEQCVEYRRRGPGSAAPGDQQIQNRREHNEDHDLVQ